MGKYYVYILANKNRSTYVGFTPGLLRRLTDHLTGSNSDYAHRFNITDLVYLEIYDDPVAAIRREKQIKSYRREKKVRLVERRNPGWFALPVPGGQDGEEAGDCQPTTPFLRGLAKANRTAGATSALVRNDYGNVSLPPH